jgi:hypothetical protein
VQKGGSKWKTFVVEVCMENSSKRKKVILLFLFFLLCAFLGFFISHYYENNKDEWIPVINSPNKNIYYNPSRIIHTRNNNVRIWLKLTGESAKDDAIKFGAEHNIPAESYNNWAYDIELWEYNCKNQTVRVVSYASYSTTNSIYSDNTISSFSPVIPGTIGEDVYKIVCK